MKITVHATSTDPIKFILSVRHINKRKAHMTFYQEHQEREMKVRIRELEERLGFRKLQAHEGLLPGTFSVGVVVNATGF